MEFPAATLFGLLFMTMGPIRAVAIFATVGTDDKAPGVRRLATRTALLTALAFVLAVYGGTGTLASWEVSLPVLIGSAGVVLLALSLQSLLVPAAQSPTLLDPQKLRPTTLVFPGLFPPIAVTIPIIFAAAVPNTGAQLEIIAIGLGIILLNWLLMLRSKWLMRKMGSSPLEIMGAVFGVLQVALAMQFIVNAVKML